MAAAVPAEGLATADIKTEAPLNLDELLVRAREGSEPAFAELISRFERLVRGQILRLTRDAELSDDLAQDIFLQLWKVLPAFTTAAALPSWIRKVTLNAVISHWRAQESQKRRLEALLEAFPPTPVEGPAATLIEEEDRDEVRAALEMLPADLRSILTLRIYENMSYEDLAESLGLEVGTVRSRLFRARQMMKDVLERWRRQRRQSRQL
jgi:RNA polymerase sigma-70 factor (ECF subfamily)